MALQTINIDDRSYDELVDELKKHIPVPEWTDHNPSDPGLMGCKACQKGSPGRAASGGIIEISESDAFFRQPVKTRCARFTSVAAKIAEAHVVGQDDHYVGLRSGILRVALIYLRIHF